MSTMFGDHRDHDLLATDDPPRPSPAVLGLAMLPAAVAAVLALVGLV